MQETRNNCFGSKKCSTTLRQAKTSKHECRNVIATYETIVASFLHLMVIVFKVLLNHISKRHFLVLHCHIAKLLLFISNYIKMNMKLFTVIKILVLKFCVCIFIILHVQVLKQGQYFTMILYFQWNVNISKYWFHIKNIIKILILSFKYF